MTTFAAILLSIIPQDDTVRDEFDLLELNHCFDCSTGVKRFTQIIFWEWDQERSRYRVGDWRMAMSSLTIVKDNGEWVAKWREGTMRREVRTTCYKETWTSNDPEVDDWQQWPKELRRGLVRPCPNRKR